MPLLRICLMFAFLQRLALSFNLTSPDDIRWEGLMWLEYKESSLPAILAVVGGVKELKTELFFIMEEASSLRNGTSTSNFVHLEIRRYAIVAKICFEDQVCWAAKMYKDRPGIFNRAVDYGNMAVMLIQQHCPNIPISTPRGCGLHMLRYCFMDWIEGQTAFEKYSPKAISAEIQTTKIPNTIVTSLAEFVYNLTTCPIPEKESNDTSYATSLTTI